MADLNLFEIDDGDVRAWLDGELNFHIKAVDGHGDPVELTSAQLGELIAALTSFRERME